MIVFAVTVGLEIFIPNLPIFAHSRCPCALIRSSMKEPFSRSGLRGHLAARPLMMAVSSAAAPRLSRCPRADQITSPAAEAFINVHPLPRHPPVHTLSSGPGCQGDRRPGSRVARPAGSHPHRPTCPDIRPSPRDRCPLTAAEGNKLHFLVSSDLNRI